MMRLNIPVRMEKEVVEGVERDVKVVTFNATLFALVRTTLDIDCKGNGCGHTHTRTYSSHTHIHSHHTHIHSCTHINLSIVT